MHSLSLHDLTKLQHLFALIISNAVSQSTTSLIYGNHSIHSASILLLVHWCLGFMGPLGFSVHGSIGFRVLEKLLECVMRQTLCEKNHIPLCFWGDYISYILMVLVNVCGQNEVCPSTSM